MAKKPTAPTYQAPMVSTPTYHQEQYKSQYDGQIKDSLNQVIDRPDFKYDPLADASYQSLAKIYNKRGNQAAQNTLGDVAALNGGYGSSYAITASQQARNDYNQELAAQVPQLEQNAYARYKDDFDMNLSTLNALQSVDDSAYNRFRDTVADKQWWYDEQYAQSRDRLNDARYNYEQAYGNYRDKMADWQWAQDFDFDRQQAGLGGSSSSGSSSGKSSGGSSGGSGYYGGSGGKSSGGSSSGKPSYYSTSGNKGGKSSGGKLPDVTNVAKQTVNAIKKKDSSKKSVGDYWKDKYGGRGGYR